MDKGFGVSSVCRSFKKSATKKQSDCRQNQQAKTFTPVFTDFLALNGCTCSVSGACYFSVLQRGRSSHAPRLPAARQRSRWHSTAAYRAYLTPTTHAHAGVDTSRHEDRFRLRFASPGNDTGSGYALPVDAAMPAALNAGSCSRNGASGWRFKGTALCGGKPRPPTRAVRFRDPALGR